MKKLLLFVVVSLFSTFITNGQKLTVMNDLESDNTDLDTEFRHSFDGGILFSFRKKFEIEDLTQDINAFLEEAQNRNWISYE